MKASRRARSGQPQGELDHGSNEIELWSGHTLRSDGRGGVCVTQVGEECVCNAGRGGVCV